MPNIRIRRARQGQAARRDAEQQRRRCVAEVARRCQNWATCREISSAIDVPERTVRGWRNRADTPPAPRGRTPLTLAPPQRQQILRFMHEVTGPAVGLPTLRAAFPRAPRAVLQHLLRRYRRAWRKRLRRPGYRLTWHRPGTVWAMDHSEATQLIDGQYDEVFAVRDLGSHYQLAWRGVASTGASEACQILEALFVEHGAPLVIKSDNGSAFTSQEMQELLARWHVILLLSPKRRPQYNGAVERANGTHKTYTHQHAVTAGHPYFWTRDDLEAARPLSNRIARPWGPEGDSPEEAWSRRASVSEHEREQFRQQREQQISMVSQEIGITSSTDISPKQRAQLQRQAISHALEALGYYSKEEVRCAPRKRKRPSKRRLERELKKLRETSLPDALECEVPPDDASQKLESPSPGGTMPSEAGAEPSVSATPAVPSAHGESDGTCTRSTHLLHSFADKMRQ